jgi:hypothetical protein
MIKAKNTKLIVPLTLAILLLYACSSKSSPSDFEKIYGTGMLVEESRQVSDVTGVDLNTIGELIIKLGDTESLIIEAQSNLMDYIETEMLGGSVRIRNSFGFNLFPTEPITYTLTVKSLDKIKLSGLGRITAPDMQAEHFYIAMDGLGVLNVDDLNASTLEINVDCSGDVKIGELKADALVVDIDSSGDVDISGGEVEALNITIDSGGSFTAPDLVSDEAKVIINSTGSAIIWVKDTLTAELTNTGSLNYRGNPTVNMTSSFPGKVTKIGD